MLSFLPTVTPCPQQFPWRAVPSSFLSSESLHFKLRLHRGTLAGLHPSLTMYFTFANAYVVLLCFSKSRVLFRIWLPVVGNSVLGDGHLASRNTRGASFGRCGGARPAGAGSPASPAVPLGAAPRVHVAEDKAVRATWRFGARWARFWGRKGGGVGGVLVAEPKSGFLSFPWQRVRGPGLAGGNREWGGPRGGQRASVGTR